jgi:hypothetical protein
MLVAPRMLPALVEENGLKSSATGPDGLLSITSVEEVVEAGALEDVDVEGAEEDVLVEVLEELDDEVDELHAASPSAPTAQSVTASVLFFIMIAPGVRPACCRRL